MTAEILAAVLTAVAITIPAFLRIRRLEAEAATEIHEAFADAREHRTALIEQGNKWP